LSEEKTTEIKEEPIEIEVDGQTAYQLKILEFDRNIAETKSFAAKLEFDKIAFIYQTAIETIKNNQTNNVPE